MSHSPLGSQGLARSPRRASYPSERADTSISVEIPPAERSPEVLQARILACLGGAGILRFAELRGRDELSDLTSTEFVDNLCALVDLRLVEPAARTEIIVIDGIRQPHSYTLLSVAVREGGRQ